MKLLSYIYILALPLMCSAPQQDGNAVYSPQLQVDEETAELTLKTQTEASPEAIEQKRIQTAFLKFETKHIDSSYKTIAQVIKTHQGFIQDDNTNKSYNTITRRLKIRIPAKNFSNTLTAIGENVSYFDTKHVASKDVTEEFIDIQARLKTKKQLEERYLELLKKAKTVKDILDIERQLATVREAIEAKQGRLKYLTNKVALSTIDIEFYQYTTNAPIATSYSTKMWNAIKGGFKGISTFILGVLYIWPLILFIFIGVFVLRKRLKKRKK